MKSLLWLIPFLAITYTMESIPDAWLPPLPIMVAAFMVCIGFVGWFMNRANRVTKYSGTIQQGRYKDAGFPAQSYQGGVK